MAIRNAKLNYLRVAFPGQSAAEVSCWRPRAEAEETLSSSILPSNFQLI